MAVRFEINALLAAALLCGSCTEEGEPQRPSKELEEDESPSKGSRDEDDDTADDDSGDDTSGDDDDTGDDTSGDDTADDDTADDDTGDAGADLTYAKFGEAFIENYCATCHSGSKPTGGFTLESLDEVEMYKAEIVARVVEDADMPPKSTRKQPTADEREKVGAWMECGPK